MKQYEIWNDHECLADKVAVADTFLSRFFGLMPKRELPRGEGLFLQDCRSIHCFFMRFPIDVVYLNDTFTVVGRETVSPWHVGTIFRGTRHVLELCAGCTTQVRPGMQLIVKEVNRNE